MIGLLVWLIVLGLIAWLVTKLPIPSPFREIIWVVLVVVLIIALLNLLPGGLGGPAVVVR